MPGSGRGAHTHPVDPELLAQLAPELARTHAAILGFAFHAAAGKVTWRRGQPARRALLARSQRLARLAVAGDARHGSALPARGSRLRRRGYVESDHLRESTLDRRLVRRAAAGGARAVGRHERGVLRARSRGREACLRPPLADLETDGRRRRVRLDRGRPGSRVRPRGVVRSGEGARRARRSGERVREDPGHRSRARGDRGFHRRRAADQRHAHLLARALRGGRRGVYRRARAAGRERGRPDQRRLRGELLRLAGRHGGGSAPRRGRAPRPAGQARHREREARAPALPPGVLGGALGGARGGRRTATAVPVGVDLDEEPVLPRRPLRRGARRTRHRQHDAARDDRGVPGPRHHTGHVDGGRRCCPFARRRDRRGRRDYDDVTATLEAEGVQKFSDSFASLLAGIDAKRTALV